MPPQLKAGTVWLVGPAGPPRMVGGLVGGVEVRSVRLSLGSAPLGPRAFTDHVSEESSGRSTAGGRERVALGPERGSVATTPTPSTTTS